MPATNPGGYQKVDYVDYEDVEKMMDANTVETETPGGGHIPSTNSSQELIRSSAASSSASDSEEGRKDVVFVPETSPVLSKKELFTVLVLCFVNLINYMDRFTIAGVLPDIQSSFQRGNSDGGLLQTVFVISYMICAPAFGYMGDRYSRRWIMILGVALWSGTTLVGSFMTSWGWFMTFRALVGIGEASYSTIAPTIISDMFTHNMRSRMLACFYFAIPVGSGLGYMIGSETAKAFGDWRFALRVTPLLGLIAVILIYFSKEPERGENEGSGHMEATSYTEDLKDLCKNRSFMYSTLGFTCVAFVTGGLSWWGPTFMHLGVRLQPGNENMELSRVSLIFGGITLISGIIGVPLGSILSQRLKKKYPRCDPLICGAGLFVSFPLILGAMFMIQVNMWAAFMFMFFGVLSLNLNWAIVGDILLYVVVPTRRSTAEAFQILISHMFGDAGSPYLVGLLSQFFLRVDNVHLPGPSEGNLDHESGFQIYAQLAENSTSLLESTSTTMSSVISTTLAAVTPRESYTQIEAEFTALQYALFSMCFVEVIGAAFFLITSFYVVRDKRKVEMAIQETQHAHQQQHNEDSTESSSLSGM